MRICFVAAKFQRAPRFTALCVIVSRYVQSIFDRGRVPYGAPEPNPEALLATMYDAHQPTAIGHENRRELQKNGGLLNNEKLAARSYSPTTGHDLAVSDEAEG
jgi:hypothetical protein